MNRGSLHKKLRVVKTADGEEFFELNKSEPGVVLISKNHTGGLDGSEDHSDGKIFPLATSRGCTVKVLKLYLSHLNPKSEALFQRPKDLNSAKFNPLTDNIWYEQRPLGHNTLENMLRKMTERVGIVSYLTNHSLRTTTVTVLSANNIETRKIKAITGHKSDTSIESYCERPTLKQFKEMSSVLSSFINGEENPQTSLAVPSVHGFSPCTTLFKRSKIAVGTPRGELSGVVDRFESWRNSPFWQFP